MKKILLLVPALLIIGAGTMKAQTIFFSEDFEGATAPAIPTGWHKAQAATNTTSGWVSGSALGSTYFGIASHTQYMAVNDDATQTASTSPAVNNGNDSLVSPSFSLVGASFPWLSFDLQYFASVSPNPVEIGKVFASTDGGHTWALLQTLTGQGGWHNVAVSLSSYIGQANVKICFFYSDGAGWAYGMALDNVQAFDPVAKEVSALNIIMNKYILAGNAAVQTVINSHGGPVVASAILNYNIDGGTAVTQTFSPAIGYGASFTASFTTQANLTAGVHNIKSWISDVNGTGLDATTADDTAYWQVSVLPGAAPLHNVLIEEYTGAWCGYCPRGGVALTQITAADPQVFGAAIHDNDAMSTTEGNVVDAIYPTGYPTGTIDRAYFSGDGAYALDNSVWTADATTREAQVVPATVSLSAVSYNSATRTITATVNATFVGAVRGTYALNCYVLENRVYGPLTDITDNGWNNHSYYYGDNTSPFYQVGLTTGAWTASVAGLTPIDYQHNHVVDKMIGGAWGDNTVVPTSLVTAGTVFSKTFTYVLPASNPGGAHRFNPDNIHILGLVQEYSATSALPNSYILNVAETKLTTNPESGASMLGIQTYEPTSFGTVSVFPNPASTSTNVGIELKVDSKVSISVYNTLGQAVVTEDYVSLTAGSHIYTLNTENLANGIYSIVVNTSNGSVTKKVVINK